MVLFLFLHTVFIYKSNSYIPWWSPAVLTNSVRVWSLHPGPSVEQTRISQVFYFSAQEPGFCTQGQSQGKTSLCAAGRTPGWLLTLGRWWWRAHPAEVSPGQGPACRGPTRQRAHLAKDHQVEGPPGQGPTRPRSHLAEDHQAEGPPGQGPTWPRTTRLRAHQAEVPPGQGPAG